MGQNKIELCALTKSYKAVKAVDSIDLCIAEGEIIGFLGPNGSGKTTTFLMMLGFTEPSGGRVSVFGVDPQHSNMEIKKMVAYLPDTFGFYANMTAMENLLYTGRLLGLTKEEAKARALENLALVGLTQERDKKPVQYSRGMRQRLGIADLMMKKPRVLILDEPTLGLDPQGAASFLELILKLSRDYHMTVLLSSHQLEHLQKICDRIAIFKAGKLLDVGAAEQLIATLDAKKTPLGEIQLVRKDIPDTAQLENLEGVTEILWEQQCATLYVRRKSFQTVLKTLVERGFAITAADEKRSSLQAVYQHYFGEERQDHTGEEFHEAQKKSSG